MPFKWFLDNVSPRALRAPGYQANLYGKSANINTEKYLITSKSPASKCIKNDFIIEKRKNCISAQ